MDRIVCPITGHVPYDFAGVERHLERLAEVLPGRERPPVYRCASEVMHPNRPYHVGVRRRRAA